MSWLTCLNRFAARRLDVLPMALIGCRLPLLATAVCRVQLGWTWVTAVTWRSWWDWGMVGVKLRFSICALPCTAERTTCLLRRLSHFTELQKCIRNSISYTRWNKLVCHSVWMTASSLFELIRFHLSVAKLIWFERKEISYGVIAQRCWFSDVKWHVLFDSILFTLFFGHLLVWVFVF